MLGLWGLSASSITTNSRVRKAELGTKSRLEPFFTTVYLQTRCLRSAERFLDILTCVNAYKARENQKEGGGAHT